MITASVVPIGFSEELSRVPPVQGLHCHRETPGFCWLPPAPAEGRERPLLPQDQVLPITTKAPHAQGVTMETLCSVHPWILFQASLAVSGAGKILGLEAIVTAGMTQNVRLLLGSSSLASLPLCVPGRPTGSYDGEGCFLRRSGRDWTFTPVHSGGTELYSLLNTVFPNPGSPQSVVFFQPDMIRSHGWWARLMNWGP